MKYMMLLHSNPAAFEALTPEAIESAMRFFQDLHQETTAAGELVDTGGLADPSRVWTVRNDEGGAVATDGPFAETKEVLASYAIYDLDTPDRAMELATRVAEATGSAVEVWPVMEFGGLEM